MLRSGMWYRHIGTGRWHAGGNISPWWTEDQAGVMTKCGLQNVDHSTGRILSEVPDDLKCGAPACRKAMA